jgi:putative MATE family efflux protein
MANDKGNLPDQVPPPPAVGANRGTTDFTTGSIARHLVVFSVPMFLGNVLQSMYSVVNGIWVGRFLGPAALGAVSVSWPIIFALLALVMGIAMATTVLVSQYYGARRLDMVRRTINNSLLLLLSAGVVISIAGVALAQPALRLINTPPELMVDATHYLRVFLGGIVFMFGYNVFGAILRGLGDSRTPLTFLVWGTLINAALDPLLIFGFGPIPRLGVEGAALAAVVAQAITTFLAARHLNRLRHVVRLDFADLAFDWELTKLTIRIGLPTGLQQVLVALGSLVLTTIINGFGATVAAAYGAGTRIESFIFMPAMTVGMAVSALVGQNLGAGKEGRVKEIVAWSVGIGTGISVLLSAVIFLFPRALLGIFTTDPALLDVGSGYLRIVALSYPLFATMFAIGGVMRGAGDTVPVMLITLASLWIVRLPLAGRWSRMPEFGLSGVWWAVVASSALGLALTWAYYATGRWKRMVAVRPPHVAPQPAESGE